MGRKNKAYVKDLHQQAYDRLTGMQAFGTSKKKNRLLMGLPRTKFSRTRPMKPIGNTQNI